MTTAFSLIEARSSLGLRGCGVERLPDVFRKASFHERIGVQAIETLVPPEKDNVRRDRGILNEDALVRYSYRLADSIERDIRRTLFPIVLGGDCSVLVGAAAGLRRLGRYGLAFLDGHQDFYSPSTSPTGELADMDLAVVTGRVKGRLSNLVMSAPYIRESDVALFGYRDGAVARKDNCLDVTATKMTAFDLDSLRRDGIEAAVSRCLQGVLGAPAVRGFWIHLDADVLDQQIMPSVDYRLEGGLSFEECGKLLRSLLASRKAVGMSVTIYNPDLDPTRVVGRRFVEFLESTVREANSTPTQADVPSQIKWS